MKERRDGVKTKDDEMTSHPHALCLLSLALSPSRPPSISLCLCALCHTQPNPSLGLLCMSSNMCRIPLLFRKTKGQKDNFFLCNHGSFTPLIISLSQNACAHRTALILSNHSGQTGIASHPIPPPPKSHRSFATSSKYIPLQTEIKTEKNACCFVKMHP